MEHCLVELALGGVVAGGFGLPVFGETDGGHGHYDVPWVWGCAGVGHLGHGWLLSGWVRAGGERRCGHGVFRDAAPGRWAAGMRHGRPGWVAVIGGAPAGEHRVHQERWSREGGVVAAIPSEGGRRMCEL